MKSIEKDLVIVGAGISGLALATELKEFHQDILILDKGRSVGGRMSTRRIGSATLDHGAQYFTARTLEFQKLIKIAMSKSYVKLWFEKEGREGMRPCFMGSRGMNGLPKMLAKNLNVQTQETVVNIDQQDERWVIATNKGQYVAKTLVLTPPSPQCLDLIQKSNLNVQKEELAAIDYHRCIAILLTLNQPFPLADPGGIDWTQQHPTHRNALAWFANNQQKGISQSPALTFHLTPEASLSLWEASEEKLFEAIQTSLEDHYTIKSNLISSVSVHRWKYSQPVRPLNKPFIQLHRKPNLVICGEAFGGPRVEGAFTSGIKTAKFLKQII